MKHCHINTTVADYVVDVYNEFDTIRQTTQLQFSSIITFKIVTTHSTLIHLE